MIRRLAAIAFAAMIVGGGALALVPTAQATPPPDHQVTLCHRTGSATNPYVQVTVDIKSAGEAQTAKGHDDHNQIGNGIGGDIIPSYTYGDFTYPGKNLDTDFGGVTGADILANGCVVPETSPSPSPSETPSPTDTPTPSETPSPSDTPKPSETPKPTKSPKPKVKPLVTHRHRKPPTKVAFTGRDVHRPVGLVLLFSGLGGLALMFSRRRQVITA
jgi:hypothetical protein